MSDKPHLAHAELVGYVDGELDEKHAGEIRLHLENCPVCLEEQQRLTDLSARIRTLVARPQMDLGAAGRADLLSRIASFPVVRMPSRSGKALRRFGWGMALAASIALALVFISRRGPEGTIASKLPAAPAAQIASLDVNGESFVALPYSNPDLPLNAPRIVEMEVPASSLSAAGITLDPSTTNGSPDRMVRANVLLGMDGQPLGLHILAAD